MTLIDLLLLLLVAGICGSIAQSLAGGRGGCIASIVLGFIGALLGMALARALNLPEPLRLQIGPQPFPVVWSIIGAALFAALLSLLSRPRY